MTQTETIEKAAQEGTQSAPFSQSTFLRRRRFIIDSKLQFGLIGSFFLLLATFLFVMTAAVFGPPIFDILSQNSEGQDLVKSSAQLLALDARYWPAIALSVVLVMVMAVGITHRLAGPLYRFKCVFRELGGQSVPRKFKLRDGDYLMQEAELLNGALDRIRQNDTAVKELRSELIFLKEEWESEGESKNSKSLSHVIENFERAMARGAN